MLPPPCHAVLCCVQAEGVELMLLMLQAKKHSRYGAVKALDYATTRHGPACERLVDGGGLKSVFGLFMGKTKVKGPKGEAKGGRG